MSLFISAIRPCTSQDIPISLRQAVDEELKATEPGKAYACNLAASRSKGNILLFVDADTYLVGDIDWYRHRPEEESFWVSPSYNIDKGYAVRHFWTTLGNTFFNFANKAPLFRDYPWAHGAFIAIRRKAFEQIGGFDENAPMEDINLFARLYNAGYKHNKSPVKSVQVRAISFPPRRMNCVVAGHSGRYIALPMNENIDRDEY